MKKFISLSVAIMLLGMGVVFVACQKTSVETAPKTNKNEVKGSNLVARAGMQYDRTLYDEDNPLLIRCDAPAGNCTGDVVVYSLVDIQVFQEVFEVIEVGNNSEIASIFNTYKDVLVEYLADEHIEYVINQQITVEHKQNSTLGTHFLVFKQNNSVIAAYPVRFQNE